MRIIQRRAGVRALSCALFAGTATLAVPAVAQETSDTAAHPIDNTILVTTARKREESVLDAPIAITGFTGDQLAAKGVTTVIDLAQQTPGLNINNNYSGRADRSYAQVIIRGFTSSSPTVSTASMFIDGVPVSSTSALSSINNPERVEVLKGPQPVYFGRQTFAGAINVVNRDPGDELGGKVEATLGTRNNYELYGELNVPVVQDVLSFRVTGDKWAKDGSYTNGYNGSTMGDQSSESYTAYMVFTPSSNLKIKAFGLYSKDDDGPSATGILATHDYSGTDGSSIFSDQSNCTTSNGNPWFCGVAPKLANGIATNTSMTNYEKDWLSSQGSLFNDDLDHYGLVRDYYHAHLNVDYDLGNGFSVSSLTGYNFENYATLLDSDNADTSSITTTYGPGYFNYIYVAESRNEDVSQEVRFAYDTSALHATLGASYLDATVTSGGGGGTDLSTATIKRRGKSEAETWGIFGGVTYKFDNGISISAEGRVQWDTLSAYSGEGGTTVTNDATGIAAGTYDDGSLLLQKTYVNFLPRAIVQYDIPGSDLMVYASWSKAVNPGQFNSSFLTYSDSIVESATEAGLQVEVKPETVTNYELGLKGALFNNAVTFSSDVYYAQWRDQLNTIAVTAVDSSGNAQILSGVANTGSVNLWGIEFEANWRVNHIVSLNAGGSINDTDVQDYTYPLTTALTGISDFSGKQMPNTSKYSAVAGISLEDTFKGSDTSWFARADYSFKSGVWSDVANTVRTPDRSVVNVRAGVKFGQTRIEGWVKNLFDNRQYTSIYDNYMLTPGYAYYSVQSAVVVGLPEGRTAGLKVSMGF
ncbi:TonB-dependent receptor [Novosphingobium profundi]|uniref:TonB-dependent receptor n=1 Tax=Novosphingobium profundi TaxID=1774954 RepID=UPI001BD971C1|nr:TonB-dependent receptor [Novosphingobium profundi]MBT0668996.1 TonB-dependent receptor [Novosphingobium profundi]